MLHYDPKCALLPGTPEVDVDWFLQNLLPSVDHCRLSAIVKELQSDINNPRWELHSEYPYTTGQDDVMSPHIQVAFEAVIRAAENVLQKDPTSRFYCRLWSSKDHGDNYTDGGCQLLAETASLELLKSKESYAMNSVVSWKVKKDDARESVDQVSRPLVLCKRNQLIVHLDRITNSCCATQLSCCSLILHVASGSA